MNLNDLRYLRFLLFSACWDCGSGKDIFTEGNEENEDFLNVDIHAATLVTSGSHVDGEKRYWLHPPSSRLRRGRHRAGP